MVTQPVLTPTDRDAILARAVIGVLYQRDPATGLWSFTVANPSILGGGCRSLEEAERRAAQAVAYALTRCNPSANALDGVLRAFDVDIRPLEAH